MLRSGTLALALGLLAASGISRADNPDCETYSPQQPDQMITNVQIVYTWDSACGPDPELGPLERDGDAIEVSWSQDLGVDPHVHDAWDNGIQPGVHSYDLTVTPDGEDPYVLHEALLVAGTAPTQDASPDGGGDGDADADGDADGDGDDDDTSDGSGDGGCSVARTAPGDGLIFLLITILS